MVWFLPADFQSTMQTGNVQVFGNGFHSVVFQFLSVMTCPFMHLLIDREKGSWIDGRKHEG